VDILTLEGRWDDHPDERLEASRHQMRPGTLRKLEIPLVAGRDFRPSDDGDGPRVAIVSESLARALFGAEEAVGRRIESGRWGGVLYEVVGVVADARHRTRLFQPFGPQWDIYFPLRQETHRLATLAVRASEGRDAGALAAPVRELVREVDPTLAVYGVTTMAEEMRDEESRARLTALLVGLYAGLAAVLAALGVYGVLAHSVRQRVREMGVRMALGARGGHVLREVLGTGMGVVGWGLLVGSGVAMGSSRLLRSALYGVSPWEPGVFALVGAMLLAVALAACFVPGWRATRVDPATVLREE
jgi:putative ABC transport system permease protein